MCNIVSLMITLSMDGSGVLEAREGIAVWWNWPRIARIRSLALALANRRLGRNDVICSLQHQNLLHLISIDEQVAKSRICDVRNVISTLDVAVGPASLIGH